jgi:hypothetical protein
MIEYFSLKSSGISTGEWESFVNSSDNGTIFRTRLFPSYYPNGMSHDISLIIRKN